VNITQAHIVVIGLIVLSTTILGVTHAIATGDITNIYIGCLGSLSGHAIGMAAEKQQQEGD
jgi:hypothetical protein